MNNTLKYKGFEGSVEYSDEDNVLHGKILHIKGLYASYEGDTLENLKKDFMEAVDFHLECEGVPNPVFIRTAERMTV